MIFWYSKNIFLFNLSFFDVQIMLDNNGIRKRKPFWNKEEAKAISEKKGKIKFFLKAKNINIIERKACVPVDKFQSSYSNHGFSIVCCWSLLLWSSLKIFLFIFRNYSFITNGNEHMKRRIIIWYSLRYCMVWGSRNDFDAKTEFFLFFFFFRKNETRINSMSHKYYGIFFLYRVWLLWNMFTVFVSYNELVLNKPCNDMVSLLRIQ